MDGIRGDFGKMLCLLDCESVINHLLDGGCKKCCALACFKASLGCPKSKFERNEPLNPIS